MSTTVAAEGTDAVDGGIDDGAVDGRGDTRRPAWSAVVVALCALVVVGAALRVAVHDPRDQPLSGDQAAFTYQALSIAGGDLSYDPSDQERWLDLGWEDQPRGIFVQRNDDGWAFAKPYGYSVLLAPFVATVGATGISLVGAALLVAYAACWYAIGRTRWSPAAAAAVSAVATVGSNAWLMAFPAHADLFVAVVVGVVALASVRMALGGPTRLPDPVWPAVVAVGAAVLVTEKLPALVALGPLLAVVVWRSPMRTRLAMAGIGALVLAASVVPYLYYSDGESWNAYGGKRFYAPSTTPWSGGDEADLVPWNTAESFSPSRTVERLTDPPDELASATLTYGVGRHTGAFTFQPVAAALAVVAALAWWRSRRDRPEHNEDGDDSRWPGVAVLATAAGGLVAYAAFYLVTFTDNYFGGGQSVGSRYYLQVSVLMAVVAVGAGVRSRVALVSAGVAAVVAGVVLSAHLRHPEESFFHLERTSAVQRLLPFDGSQADSWRFSCDPEVDCVPPPLVPFGS